MGSECASGLCQNCTGMIVTGMISYMHKQKNNFLTSSLKEWLSLASINWLWTANPVIKYYSVGLLNKQKQVTFNKANVKTTHRLVTQLIN